MSGESSFNEILRELGVEPNNEKKNAEPPKEPEDCLCLSVHAQKGLSPLKSPLVRPAKPMKKSDAQGNKTVLSLESRALAGDFRAAWETPLK